MMVQAALISILSVIFPAISNAREPISLPAATAELRGVTLATQQIGSFAGDVVKFAKGFTNGQERLVFSVDSTAGLYEARLWYRAGGFKGYVLEVNGLAYAATLAKSNDSFVPSEPVRILLTHGKNTLTVGGGWGHYEISRIELLPIDVPLPPKMPAGGLSDKQATQQAKTLWAKLAAGYGRTTLSGVYADEDVRYVRDKTGKVPAILGADLSDYSPSRIEHGTKPTGMDQKLIQRSREGLILTLSWHWNAPTGLVDNAGNTDQLPVGQRWYMGFNTKATTFDFAAALADDKSEGYRLLIRDIDAIAVPLKKLQDAGVPVLWRPLHEAEGGWFWWGSKGPEAYVKLWRLLYTRLTKQHQLHNLIWVFTAGQDLKWYPGNDVVDIIGVDDYPKDNRDPLTADWDTVLRQFGERKLLTLSEVGFVPDLNWARAHGVYWSYFNTWNGDNGPKNLPPQELKRRFDSKFMASN